MVGEHHRIKVIPPIISLIGSSKRIQAVVRQRNPSRVARFVPETCGSWWQRAAARSVAADTGSANRRHGTLLLSSFLTLLKFIDACSEDLVLVLVFVQPSFRILAFILHHNKPVS